MTDSSTAAELVAELHALLDVEEIDTDLYRGPRKPGGQGRVFGGQVIAQALMAGIRSTDPGRVAHSLHAYFMRPGSEDHPIIYRVERDHDGGSFSTRRVIAFQQGKPILNLAASFQMPEAGLEHQIAMPDVPPPEDVEDEIVQRQKLIDELPERFRPFFLRRRPFEMRPIDPRSWRPGATNEPRQHIWLRAAAPVAADPAMHQAMLAHASDMNLLGTATRAHGVSMITPGFQGASLDHALWFHREVRVDEWMLYATDSPWAGGGRGFNRGSIFARDGRLIASVAQEGLMRMRAPNESGDAS